LLIYLLLITETQPDPTLISPALPSPDFSWLFLKVIGAMILVCLAAFVVIKYLLPRGQFLRRGRDSQIEILERFTLEPKKNLYILKVAQKMILLGTTDVSMNTLLELPETELKKNAPESK